MNTNSSFGRRVHLQDDQATVLHILCRIGDVDGVRLMLSNGADCNATTRDNYTPLHLAVKEGHDDVIKVLLENGAKQNIKTKVNIDTVQTGKDNML